MGVESRVEDLAGRPAGFRPPGAADFESIIPLPEIVSEIEQTGVQSKKVRGVVEALTGRLGPEMAILRDIPVEDIRRAGTPVLAEAISRLRAGHVHRTAGYDGEFGTIRLFEPHELDGHGRSPLLFSLDRLDAASAAKTTAEVSDREAAVPDAVLAEPQPQTGTDAAVTEISGGETQAAGETCAESQQPPAEKSAAASRWLQGLDEAQTRAAETSEGPLVIIAGPGTGKTRTLTRRLAHLIDDLHADPARCLAVTFTRKAAEEMRERLRDLIPAGAPSIIVDTFHGLALRILREDAVSAGLPPDFAIMDEEGEAGRRALIGRCFQVQPAEAGRMADRFRREPGSGEAETFRRFLAEQGLVDLDAVIPMTVELLETHPEIAARWRARLDHVSIDEFQDIDEAQYRLACLLSLGTESLCVIGDPDQSIYSFRGASPGFFRRFIEDHPGTTEIRLVCNYRSSPVIVSAALHAIAPQTLVPGRALTARRAGYFPDKIQLFEAQDARAEAEFIAGSIESRVGGTSHRTFDEHPEIGHADASSDRSFCDFAVLYRTDAQAEALMEALSRRSIPCQKSGHTRLSAHRGVRELRDMLRQADLAGSQSEMSLPQRLLEAARQLAERRGGWRDDSSGAEALELLQPLASRSGSLTEFLAAIQQGAETDAPDVRAQKVSLLTMHASKGLEFPVVFIAGCDDGLIPFRLRAGQLTEEALAEERRLFFVAVTRARDELILTRARKRLIQGAECAPGASAFLRDLDPRCLSNVTADAAKGMGRRRRQRQLKLF